MRTTLLAATCIAMMTTTGFGGDVTIERDAPDLDRWFYPFNFTPGFRTNLPVFGVLDEPKFENRHSLSIVGWDLDADIETGLGAHRYNITSATILLEADGQHIPLYDDSYDPFGTYLDPADPDHAADVDPGRPVVVHGTGFRNGFSLDTFAEDTPYGPVAPFLRNAYPLAFEADGAAYDPSDNVTQRRDVTPWAIATVTVDDVPLAPGEIIPEGAIYTLAINTDDPFIQQSLRESVDAGRLLLTLSSLYPAEFDGSKGSGEYPTFYTKENPLVAAGAANAAQLVLEVEIVDLIGDFNEDGTVDVADLLQLLAAWGSCADCETCIEDLNDDCMVNVEDLLTLLANWTA